MTLIVSVLLADKKLEDRPTAEVLPDLGAKHQGMLGLWRLRHLTAIMVRRDLLGRYKGSMMGFFWTIINPLGHLLLYTFVFSIILRVKFNNDPSTGSFALYLMTGLLPWTALSESLSRATSCVLEQENLVKRVVFPLEVLPFAVAISSMISQCVGLVLLIGMSTILTGTIHPTILYLPLIMLSQMILIAGINWFLASLGVYLQDLKHVMSLATSIWMYATPVVYPISQFPPKLQWLLWVNPMAGIVTDYRRIMLQGIQPDWNMYAAYTSIAVIIWFGGYYFFSKIKRSFADVV